VQDRDSKDIRALVRYRIDLAERSTQVKNKVHNITFWTNTSRGIWRAFLQSMDGVAIRLSNIDRQLVDSYIREITMLGELIQGVEKQLASHAINDRRVDLLLGFTGIDYYGALLLLYEIGDIKRFRSPKKLVSWTLWPHHYTSQEMSDIQAG
jgi:transposase